MSLLSPALSRTLQLTCHLSLSISFLRTSFSLSLPDKLELIPRMRSNSDFLAFIGLVDNVRETSCFFPKDQALGLTLAEASDRLTEVTALKPLPGGGPSPAMQSGLIRVGDKVRRRSLSLSLSLSLSFSSAAPLLLSWASLCADPHPFLSLPCFSSPLALLPAVKDQWRGHPGRASGACCGHCKAALCAQASAGALHQHQQRWQQQQQL